MKIKLKRNEILYPLYTEDKDGWYPTTWNEKGKQRWFYAVMCGFGRRAYWLGKNQHQVVIIFDNKDEAKKYYNKKIEVGYGYYISAGWITKKNKLPKATGIFNFAMNKENKYYKLLRREKVKIGISK